VRIVLVRHGKPDGVSTAPISGREIGRWTAHYGGLGLARSLPPPAAVCALASDARCILASDLPRARESAAWLAEGRTVHVEPDLREAPLPASLNVPLRLPPGVWIVVARLLWLMNACTSEETVTQTRERAAQVAAHLEALTTEHDSVMAVGHGMFNRLVAARLRRSGWQGPSSLPHHFWSTAVFVRNA